MEWKKEWNMIISNKVQIKTNKYTTMAKKFVAAI